MAVLRHDAPLDGVISGLEGLEVHRECPSIGVNLRRPLVFALSTAVQYVKFGEQCFDRRVEPNRHLLGWRRDRRPNLGVLGLWKGVRQRGLW